MSEEKFLEWVERLYEEVSTEVVDFPEWSVSSLPGATQEFIGLFMKERAKITNLLTSIYCQKRNLRVAYGNFQEEVSHASRKGNGLYTKVMQDISDMIAILLEKKAYYESAITSLRSIQSSMVQQSYGSNAVIPQKVDIASFIRDTAPAVDKTPVESHKRLVRGKQSTSNMETIFSSRRKQSNQTSVRGFLETKLGEPLHEDESTESNSDTNGT